VLASAGFHGTNTLWSVSNGRPLLSFKAHEKAITGLVMADGGNSLASSSVDRTINLFDLRMLLMTRLPVEQMRVRGADLAGMTDGKGITESDRRWLDFAAALLRWKGRYDIALEEPRRIDVGEFDIEIVPLETTRKTAP
jgi:WD40 repeat protein